MCLEMPINYALHPVSQKFPQLWLGNSSNNRPWPSLILSRKIVYLSSLALWVTVSPLTFGLFRVPSYELFATSHTVIYTDRCVCLYSNGATKSGLFCAICDAISRMRSDGEIDVYMAARNVHIVRPESVSSEV